MDLTGKLGKGLRTGILATTLTGLIGCAEFEELRDDFIESTTWEMAAAKLEKKGEYEKARAMRNIGNLRIARRIAEAGRSEVNVYTNRDNEQQRTQQLPENVVLSSNDNYNPAQGYEWINPKDNNDLRVKRKQKVPENTYTNKNRILQQLPENFDKYTLSQAYDWFNYEMNDDLRIMMMEEFNDVRQGIVDEDFRNNSTGLPEGQFYYFAANYYKDFNEDGTIAPSEFVGIKKRFREDEKMILASYDMRFGLKDYEGEIRIYSPDGDIIDIGEVNEQNYTHNSHLGEIRVFGQESGVPLMDFLVENGGYGNYKAVWKLNGKYNGSTEFEIVPSLRSEKVTKE